MMTMNATGAEQTVAEQNWDLLSSLMYVKSIVGTALDALAESADVLAANRLLTKTCEEVSLAVARNRKGVSAK